jgi:4-hydroxy-2-oxoheptanedioate aldolase
VISVSPKVLAFVKLPGVAHSLVMASMPWDGLIFDLQHGAVDPSQAGDGIAVAVHAGVPAWVRVSANDAGLIGHMLDAGATGIICPQVESPSDAQSLVSACRYPPEGARSLGPLRAELLHGPRTTSETNRAVRVFAIIESATAMAVLDEIVATPGLDGILLGIADLAVSEGRSFNGYADALTRESTEVAAGTAHAAGRMVGLPLLPGDDESFVYGLEPDLVVAGADVDFLFQAGRWTIDQIARDGASRPEPAQGRN